ncbi:MAG TPA: hypothetical protein VL001_12030 [Candidimonas sp.]|nr:hypothetical protein [Candidimonas sp.]
MKLSIILLSVLACVATWWWHARSYRHARPALRQRVKTIIRALVAGVVVYFGLMSIALVYLMFSTA